MKHKYKISFLLTGLLCFGSSAFAQKTYVNREWENTTGSVGAIHRTASALDNNQNLIVVSNTVNGSNNTDVLITKYNPDGVVLWQQTFDGSAHGNDYAVQLKINNSNEIFVASTLEESTGVDFGLLKYSSNGTLVWSSSWNGSANGVDVPADLDIDNSGNIYIVGGSGTANGTSDYAIVKFNSSGTYQWHTNYDYANLHDVATSIDFNANSIVVTGASASTPTNWDFATLKINTTNGSIIQTERTVVAGVGLDNAVAVTTDASNNTYITGYVEVNGNRNIQTVKLNANFGLEWVKNFEGGLEDVAKAIGVDDFGNVYIAGTKENPNGGKDYITIKYDQNGNEVWNREFGSEGNNFTATAENLAILDNGDIVVTGTLDKNNVKEFATVKYTSAGDLKFVQKFDAGSQNNEAKSVIVKNDNIYVSGISEVNGTNQNATVKYSQIEKDISFVYAPNGNPVFEENDLIVRLDTSAIIKDAIDKKGFEAGKIDNFVKPFAVNQIKNAVKDYCPECNIMVYKIFRTLTTRDTATISRLGDTIPIPHFWATLLFEFPQGVDITLVADDLNAMFPIIKYTHPNLTVTLTATANDSEYGSQASLHPTTVYDSAHINIEPAWDLETGKSFIKVGVFDTGIDWNHEDFGNGTSTGTKVVDGWDFQNNTQIHSNPIGDPGGHGTPCAGIIGAIRNNANGIAGIAGGRDNSVHHLDSMGVSLYSMRIIEPWGNILNWIADAIITSSIDDPNQNYAFGLNIMSNSWRIHENHTAWFTDTNITLLTEATHFANRAKVTFVAARGNEGYSNQSYPAIIDDDWILCVGGTGTDGWYVDGVNEVYSASTGPEIDIAAPGASAIIRTTNNNGLYQSFNGTSAATPHVAGTASLLMSYLNHPTPNYNNLAPEDIEYLLQMTAYDTDSIGVDILTGHGRINAGAALEQVDKSKFHLSHYGTDNNVSTKTITLYSSNDTIKLTERFENANSQWFLANTKYVVNTYQVNATVYHNLPVLDTIVAYWPRPSSSNVFALFDANNNLQPRERITINSLNQGSADLLGYVYEVSDTLGNFIGWWPFDTTQVQPQFTYTILRYDPFIFNSIVDIELSDMVSVYPNPTNNNQTISFDLPISSDVNIDLYDITGKLVLNVYSGKMNMGQTQINVPISKLPNGMYVYHFLIDDKTYHSKIIKQ